MFESLKSVPSRALGKLTAMVRQPAPPTRCPAWNPRNKIENVELDVCRTSFDLADLSTLDAALAFFHKNGFVHISHAVPVEDCQGVVAGILGSLGMKRDEPEGWYADILPPNGMVELYQHPAVWRVRESAAIHQISSAIHGTEKLWTSMDRLNFKVPVDERYPLHDSSAFIHWDTDSSNFPPVRFLQGVVMLEDTDETMGGFQCVPGMYGKHLTEWAETQPAERDVFFPDLRALPPDMKVTTVRAKAGDYVVWDSTLAHGSGRNLSNRPRFAQYVSQSLIPVEEEYREDLRRQRITAYQNLTCIPFEHHFGDPRGWEKANYPPPPLTEHGQKLLGLRDW